MMDVSVIIPTYNRLWSLPRAINSCRNTKCNTEIIIVDDGSTDGTWEWLTQQTGLVIHKQHNQGQTYAANKGVTLARGQFIRFLDSDDFLHEGVIDLQYQKAVATGAQLVCARVDGYTDTTGNVTIAPDIDNWDDFLEVQLGSGYGSHYLGMLFHRDLAIQVPRRPEFSFRDDRMFLLEVALLNPRWVITEGCGGYWVKHQQQMQANYAGHQSTVANWQHLQIYRHILPRLEINGKLTMAYKKAACTVLWPLAHWMAKDNLRDAVNLYQWILELDPDFKVPAGGSINTLYRWLGFKTTEKILKTRRFLLQGWN